MNVKQLDHLNLTVHNFAESAHWYRQVFGAEVVEEGQYEGQPWGVVKAGDAMWCMYQKQGDSKPSRDHGQLRIGHFGLRITDRVSWEQVVDREQLELHYGGGPVRWPRSTSWYIQDPSGYLIEVALWDDDVIRFSA